MGGDGIEVEENWRRMSAVSGDTKRRRSDGVVNLSTLGLW